MRESERKRRASDATGLISLSMRQAEEASGLSRRTLYERISAGELESVTVGRKRLILTDSLRKMITGSPARATVTPTRTSARESRATHSQ